MSVHDEKQPDFIISPMHEWKTDSRWRILKTQGPRPLVELRDFDGGLLRFDYPRQAINYLRHHDLLVLKEDLKAAA